MQVVEAKMQIVEAGVADPPFGSHFRLAFDPELIRLVLESLPLLLD